MIPKIMLIAVCLIAVVSMYPVYAEISIPGWIKNTAKFWSNDEVNDADYANSISYLIEHGIIDISSQYDISKDQKSCDDLDEIIERKVFLIGVWYSSQFLTSNDQFSYFTDMIENNHNRDMENINAKLDSDNSGFYASCPNYPAIVDIIPPLESALNSVVYQIGDDNSGSGNNSQCSLFCDSTGYEPSWASSMGQIQALAKCMNSYDSHYGTKDGNWCFEYNGYVADSSWR